MARKPTILKILLMDDDDVVREELGQMIEHLGYEVAYAKNGEESVELYRTQMESGKTPFDAVIFDLTVRGGMGGAIAIQKLLEIDPKAKAIISSGYSDDPIVENFRQYGFVDALVKPYKMNRLREVLEKL